MQQLTETDSDIERVKVVPGPQPGAAMFSAKLESGYWLAALAPTDELEAVFEVALAQIEELKAAAVVPKQPEANLGGAGQVSLELRLDDRLGEVTISESMVGASDQSVALRLRQVADMLDPRPVAAASDPR